MSKKPSAKPQSQGSLQPDGYAPILVMPLNTAPETVAEARAHGYLPVLTDDPAKVVTIFPITGTRVAGAMLMAALHGLCSRQGYGDTDALKAAFVSELNRRLLKQEGA